MDSVLNFCWKVGSGWKRQSLKIRTSKIGLPSQLSYLSLPPGYHDLSSCPLPKTLYNGISALETANHALKIGAKINFSFRYWVLDSLF